MKEIDLGRVVGPPGEPGTTDYNGVKNRPSIKGTVLEGDKAPAELGLVEKQEGMGLSHNDFTDTEKEKLAGIAEGANNYKHPATHPASMIEQDSTRRFVSDAKQAEWDAIYRQAVAYADRLIANLINGAPETLDTLGEIANAMKENADVVAALQEAIGKKANETELARVAFSGSYSDLADKPAIPTASSAVPKTNGTASAGTESRFARGDHVHPLQTKLGTATVGSIACPVYLNAGTPVACNGVVMNSGVVSNVSFLNLSWDTTIAPVAPVAQNYGVAIGSGANANARGVAFGYNAVSPPYAIAIGCNSKGSGESAIAIGENAAASENCIVLGAAAYSSGTWSVAIGRNSVANGGYSIALGYGANASSMNSVALGSSAKAINANATAIGFMANAIGTSSTALGRSASSNGTMSMALGYVSHSQGNYSTAVGTSSTASGSYSTAVGYFSAAISANAAAFGYKSNAKGTNSVAVGINAVASNNYDCAIGFGALTNTGGYNTAIGLNTVAGSGASTAIGCEASATGNWSTAIGWAATTSNSQSLQLGSPNYLSSLTSKVALTVTSDERDKIDIAPLQNALAFINKINAISYYWNGRENYIPRDEEGNEQLTEEERQTAYKYGFKPYDKEAHALGTKKGSRRRVGVSAQATQRALIEVYGSADVANIVNDNLYDFEPDEIPEGVESHLGVTYGNFIPFLIKAIQELSEKEERQQEQIDLLMNVNHFSS